MFTKNKNMKDKKNIKFLIISIVSVLFIIALPFGGFYLLEQTKTVGNTEIKEVANTFIKSATTIGDVDKIKTDFANRFDYINIYRKESYQNTKSSIAVDSTQFSEDNLPDMNKVPEYSGTLHIIENKGINITDIEVTGDTAKLTFNTTVKEYVSYYLADEEGFEDSKLFLVKTKYREIPLKNLSLNLKKEDGVWKVVSSDNLNTIGAQYFSTWDGTTKIVEPKIEYKEDKTKEYKLDPNE